MNDEPSQEFIADESAFTGETDESELEALVSKLKTNILIIGSGGAGNNTLTRLYKEGMTAIELLAVNTDAQHLLNTPIPHRMLIGKKLTRGFSLIEVVVSLLILSITFTAFSLLLDQNLKAQLQKEKYVYKTTKEINLLTLYSNKSSTDDVSLKKYLGVKKEREKILSSFGIRREIEIIFIDGDKEIKIKIIR